MQPFRDRTDAGEQLAVAVSAALRGTTDAPAGSDERSAGTGGPVVLGLARGGVPVAAPVASALGAPLDVYVVRKLGVPGRPELAFGAIASDGSRVQNDDVVARAGLTDEAIARVVTAERAELDRRVAAYRAGRPQVALAGRTVVLVDDGLATGASMRAAVNGVRAAPGQVPARVVVAVPVGAIESIRLLAGVADDVVVLATPEPFLAVGAWYADFGQTTDDDVRAILARA